jgi:tetratricopeptide (TPR) repeat protein
MDWSHQLLAADEALLFRHLGVFAGGFTLGAVEAVHGPDAVPPLLRLTDKSLVVVERRRHVQRYRLLETIRQYAEEKLVDSGEAAALRDRHRDYYLALAEEAAAGLLGPDQVLWVERLETEHDNFRAALSWCHAAPDGADKQERLAGALGRFWRDRGYMREGFAWLLHASARRPGAVSVGRGRALNWAAMIAREGDFGYRDHVGLLEESISVLRQAGAPAELSLALRHRWGNMGATAVEAGLLEEALANARAAGDRREIGWGLLYLSQVALNRGDLPEARRLADEALAILRGLDPNSLLNAFLQLGRVALAQGEQARAETIFREMVERSHEIGDRVWVSDAWLGLAGAARARGDLAGARGCFRALVSELRAASSVHLLPRLLLGLALLEAGDGQDRRAARLLGAFEASGGTAEGWPLEGFHLGPDIATLQARAEHEPFAALAEGRGLTVDQALDEALADASRSPRSVSLSARERKVGALVAAGQTNPTTSD